tara:strand:+ start:1164 stop:1328 length:165 start_codon:yes stop_codon:yes gene_type:complete
MKQYKYFFISDSSREQIGLVEANSRYEAMKKAASKKQLTLNHFLEIFSVEHLNG